MSTFAIHTLGCKVNSYESQSMCDDFKAKGYEEVNFHDQADIYIIHTCAVTNTAAQKSRQKIRQAIKLNADATICVVGCYVQTNAEEILKLEGVDVLIGSSGKQEIVSLVEDAIAKKQEIENANTASIFGKIALPDIQKTAEIFYTSGEDHKQTVVPTFSPILHLKDVRKDASFEEQPVMHFDYQVRAYLKVQDGCNQFCSYCIIPYTRGKERSLNPDKAVEMAKELVSKGHKEIVLAGIHTGRYGVDHQSTLVNLLRRLLHEVEGLQRLRLSSIEANEITDEMIDLFKQDHRLARHLHIPLQSGEDSTLSLMNRKYDTKEFLDKLHQIRTSLPGISVSSDVIVGFPQESREDFQKTMEFIQFCELSFLHVFPYSKRQNTVAANMKDHVEESEKKRRVHELSKLSNDMKQAYYKTFVGKEVEVLMEQSQDGVHHGYSSEYIKVSVSKQSRDLKGMLVGVVVDGINEDGCYGHLA